MEQETKMKSPRSFLEYALSLTLYTLGFEEGSKENESR